MNEEIDLHQLLRAKVERTAGFTPKSPKDFTRLEREIFAATRELISTSTLKRFWGEEQLDAIKKMLLLTAKNMGGQTEDESALYIPAGLVMQVLVGDPMHLGVLTGMNTEDPCCVVLRVEMNDELVLHNALLECFKSIEIEVVEDVDDEPWPFE